MLPWDVAEKKVRSGRLQTSFLPVLLPQLLRTVITFHLKLVNFSLIEDLIWSSDFNVFSVYSKTIKIMFLCASTPNIFFKLKTCKTFRTSKIQALLPLLRVKKNEELWKTSFPLNSSPVQNGEWENIAIKDFLWVARERIFLPPFLTQPPDVT